MKSNFQNLINFILLQTVIVTQWERRPGTLANVIVISPLGNVSVSRDTLDDNATRVGTEHSTLRPLLDVRVSSIPTLRQ